MTPITDKIRQVFADDVISFTLNGKLYSGTILEVFTKWGEVADKLGNDADVLANENARLVSELETKTRAVEEIERLAGPDEIDEPVILGIAQAALKGKE